MSALGRWLGRYSGRWFGLTFGEPPPPHTVSLIGFRYEAHFGRPRIGGAAPGHSGDLGDRDYIPPPHRIRLRSLLVGPSFGRPSITLRATPTPVLAVASFGRPRITLRPMLQPVKHPRPAQPSAVVDRYAQARREDEEMIME